MFHIVTLSPSKRTVNPTWKPTSQPTSRPTDPDTSTCDDNIVGQYNGVTVTFMVYMPFLGDLQFNAKASSFVVTDMEAWTASDILIANDADHDEIVTLQNIQSGEYKFVILGANAQSGTFNVTIQCCMDHPSGSPTASMTLVPNVTRSPTNAPTSELNYSKCGPTSTMHITPSPTELSMSSTFAGTETDMVRGLHTTVDDISHKNHIVIPVYKSDVFMAVIVITIGILLVIIINIVWCVSHGHTKAKFKRSTMGFIDGNVQSEQSEQSDSDQGSHACVDSVTTLHNTELSRVPQQDDDEGDNSDHDVLSEITAGQEGKAGHRVVNLDSDDSDSDELVQGITLGQECDDKYGKCNDCGQEKMVKLYDGDDLFYCNECWELYV